MAVAKEQTTTANERIFKTEFSDEMSRSYLDYAMSVIVSRAIPDVRDGLKPVQRRTLYAMYELGVRHDQPYRKCARIVGDTMGKYHPHGDSSIYETLVVMAQDWKKGEVLVDGHGNFGSIEGDGAAASRYTEARLSKLADTAFLADLDQNVVDFVPNFDETEREPVVLPVKIPNLLINGADGIAVGMKTSIPPHNLREVLEAMKLLLEKPTAATAELMEKMPGPDFPTGGEIINREDLSRIYESGVGKLRLRGKIVLEPGSNRAHSRLVITEIPYTMIGSGLSKFITDVGNLIETRQLPEVTDFTNQSSKEGIRLVLELKNGADPERVKNILFRKTGLEETFGVNMLAIVDGVPRTVGLREILRESIDFQIERNTRKYTTLLRKEKEKAEVQEGLIRAIDQIDVILEVIRGSRTAGIAKSALMGDASGVRFRTEEAKRAARDLAFTQRQAAAILEMRLSRLIGLEIRTLKREHEQTVRLIGQYDRILKSPQDMTRTILRELDGLIREFGRERRTQIVEASAAEEIPAEEAEQDLIFAVDRFGYAKTYDPALFGRSEETLRAENRTIFLCRNTGKIFLFTDIGAVHQLKVSDLPTVRARDKGSPLDNLCRYDSRKERMVGIFPDAALKEGKFLFVTERGMVKIVAGQEFFSNRRTLAATRLQEGDRLLWVGNLSGTQLALRTRDGFALRFSVSEIPEQKRASIGVKGIALTPEDRVQEACQVSPRSKTAEETRPKWTDVKLLHRGARGVKPRR